MVHYLLWEGGRGRKPNQNCHRERRGGWNSGRNDLGDGTSASERLCCKYSIQNGNITFGPWGENLITITSGGPLSDEIWTSLSNWRAWDLSKNLIPPILFRILAYSAFYEMVHQWLIYLGVVLFKNKFEVTKFSGFTLLSRYEGVP